MRWRNAAVVLLVAVLGGTAVYRQLLPEKSENDGNKEEKPEIGYLAPSFALTGMDSGTYQVGSLRDKPLVLNFWASWCAPCKEEAPLLARLYEKYKDQLDIYAVNMTGNDTEEKARAFAERYRFSFPVLLDRGMEASGLYNVTAIPTSYLIDRNGKVVDVIHLLEGEELNRKLKKLLEAAD